MNCHHKTEIKEMTCKWFSVCPLRRWEKQGKVSKKWKQHYCLTEDNWKHCKRYQMEAQGIPHVKILPDGSKLKK